ncbi:MULTISPECIES: T9SS type A sorting domain-containing protein [Flavobacterium]|uniref:T9SS type A sorting domain-containing protein n=1 Tax=Flavobacterium TaxID=237 RepID=UPI001FCABB4A|nr:MULTISPECIES: T9SS type A sorting domain-containing protein [Flavobacterium]UOK41141.1 T9SS type A sorting domain-containing protein [Flavobacterium enshiense]
MTIGTYQTSENPTPENNQEPVGIVISRFNWDGELDAGFGQNGYIRTTLPYSRALGSRLVMQRDDKILVGATFCEAWMSSHPYTVVLRYDAGERLAVSEFNETDVFRVYPNPFKESVTIDFTLDDPEILSMDLYSNDGRKVANLMKNQEFQGGYNSQKLDFPGALADGVYSLKVFNGNDAVTIKIVK